MQLPNSLGKEPDKSGNYRNLEVKASEMPKHERENRIKQPMVLKEGKWPNKLTTLVF
jgi:hypothetical protein